MTLFFKSEYVILLCRYLNISDQLDYEIKMSNLTRFHELILAQIFTCCFRPNYIVTSGTDVQIPLFMQKTSITKYNLIIIDHKDYLGIQPTRTQYLTVHEDRALRLLSVLEVKMYLLRFKGTFSGFSCAC